MKLLIIMLMLLIPVMGNTYEVEAEQDPADETRSIIIFTDDCDVAHKLNIKNSELSGDKPLEWLNKLLKANRINSCLDK